MNKVLTWINETVMDPDGSPSSTRIAAILLTLTAIGLAIAGFALNRPEPEVLTTLLGGGALSFFSRTKSLVDPK